MPTTRSKTKRKIDELETDEPPFKQSKISSDEEEEYNEGDDNSDTSSNYSGSSSPSDISTDEEQNLVSFINDQMFNDEDISEQLLEELKEEDKEAYNNFVLVRKEIEKNLPDIKEILKSKIRLKDKAKIVELYELYMNTPPVSEEHLDLKYRINSILKRCKLDFKESENYTEEELALLKEKSKELKDKSSGFILKHKILNLKTSRQNIQAIYRKYLIFKEMQNTEDSDKNKLKTWLSNIVKLPFDNVKITKEQNITNILKNAIDLLDRKLYGMKSVKEQILIFLNSKLRNPDMKGCSLGLMGPPGVGKTTIARYISEVLEWPFEQISFGGVNSNDFLKGHDYTYVGSQPGIISKSLMKMKYKNGILFFDEYEKISDKQEIVSALLHITDPQQNHEFIDNYFSDIHIDLSSIWFIYSMNEKPQDRALRDRMYTITVPGYSLEDKENILNNYTLPKTLKNVGIKEGDIQFTRESSKYFLQKIDMGEPGIRNLEKQLKNLVNKINFVNHNKNIPQFEFMSFDTKIDISYPLTITNDIIDNMCKERHINISKNMMYL